MFRNMKIGIRLSLGFGLLVALLLSVAFIGVARMNSLHVGVDLLVKDRYAKVMLASRVDNEVSNIARYMRNMIITTDPEVAKENTGKIYESRKAIAEAVEQLDKVAGGTPAQAAGTKTDKPHLSDIVITKQQDNSTGKLIHE